MAPIPRLRDYEGPAIFSYGFRPFFLLGSIYAGLDARRRFCGWVTQTNIEGSVSRIETKIDKFLH